jgi:hypothetical protein
MKHVYFSKENHLWRIPRWWLREEAESVPPKVKSWRDTGYTPHRKNHREEAKL